jgi:hypothetical protein
MPNYIPEYLSHCTDREQEESELRKLILRAPADIQELKASYKALTGSRFRKRKGE